MSYTSLELLDDIIPILNIDVTCACTHVAVFCFTATRAIGLINSCAGSVCFHSSSLLNKADVRASISATVIKYMHAGRQQ